MEETAWVGMEEAAGSALGFVNRRRLPHQLEHLGGPTHVLVARVVAGRVGGAPEHGVAHRRQPQLGARIEPRSRPKGRWLAAAELKRRGAHGRRVRRGAAGGGVGAAARARGAVA